MVEYNYNHSLLLKEIDKQYEGSNIAIKITKFCKDVKIKLYRFKRVVEQNKGCFLINEVDSMKKILNISDTDHFFLNKKESKG